MFGLCRPNQVLKITHWRKWILVTHPPSLCFLICKGKTIVNNLRSSTVPPVSWTLQWPTGRSAEPPEYSYLLTCKWAVVAVDLPSCFGFFLLHKSADSRRMHTEWNGLEVLTRRLKPFQLPEENTACATHICTTLLKSTTRTISGLREAIIVKCLAERYKCQDRDSNPHSAEQKH